MKENDIAVKLRRKVAELGDLLSEAKEAKLVVELSLTTVDITTIGSQRRDFLNVLVIERIYTTQDF